jgi:hypothetical protein
MNEKLKPQFVMKYTCERPAEKCINQKLLKIFLFANASFSCVLYFLMLAMMM